MTGWRPLPGGTGTVLAVSGDVSVAATLGRLTAWSGDDRVIQVEVDDPNPARPRIIGDRVFWGAHLIDVGRRTHRSLRSGGALLPGYAQVGYAWSADGNGAVAAGRRVAPVGESVAPTALVRLFDANGEAGAELWRGADVPPIALWWGNSGIVVGHRSPDVFDLAGGWVRSLAGTTSPTRIEGGGSRILVVEAARLAVWDLPSGVLMGEVNGTWVDAALTGDGRQVVAVDFAGKIMLHRVGPGLPVMGELPAEDAVTGVAVSVDRVLASFAQLPAIRTVPLPAVE